MIPTEGAMGKPMAFFHWWNVVIEIRGRARLQPCRSGPMEMRALAPEGLSNARLTANGKASWVPLPLKIL